MGGLWDWSSRTGEALHQVAMQLREAVRTCDDIYRSAGEAFISIFPDAPSGGNAGA